MRLAVRDVERIAHGRLFEGIQDQVAKSTARAVSGRKWIVVCRIGSADNSLKLSTNPLSKLDALLVLRG